MERPIGVRLAIEFAKSVNAERAALGGEIHAGEIIAAGMAIVEGALTALPVERRREYVDRLLPHLRQLAGTVQ